MGGQTGKGFQIIYLFGGFCKYTLFGVRSNKNNSAPQIYVDINVHPCCKMLCCLDILATICIYILILYDWKLKKSYFHLCYFILSIIIYMTGLYIYIYVYIFFTATGEVDYLKNIPYGRWTTLPSLFF